MKNLFKSMALAGLLSVASVSAFANTVVSNLGSGDIDMNSDTTYTVNAYGDNNVSFFNIDVGTFDFLVFDLIDTNMDGFSINYVLEWIDDGMVSQGIASWTHKDDVAPNETFAQDVDSNYTYILSIANPSSILNDENYLFLSTTQISGGNNIPDVPLPAAAWLFGSALLGAGVIGRKKKAAV